MLGAHTAAPHTRNNRAFRVPLTCQAQNADVKAYLVDEADSWSLTAIQEVNVDNLQLLQSDVIGLELTVVPVQWDHFEQSIIKPQANHSALRVHNCDNTSF